MGLSTDVKRAGLFSIVAIGGALGCAHDGTAPSSGGGGPRSGGRGESPPQRVCCHGAAAPRSDSVFTGSLATWGGEAGGGGPGATASAAVPADVSVEASGGGGGAGGGGAGGGAGKAERRRNGEKAKRQGKAERHGASAVAPVIGRTRATLPAGRVHARPRAPAVGCRRHARPQAAGRVGQGLSVPHAFDLLFGARVGGSAGRQRRRRRPRQRQRRRRATIGRRRRAASRPDHCHVWGAWRCPRGRRRCRGDGNDGGSRRFRCGWRVGRLPPRALHQPH